MASLDIHLDGDGAWPDLAGKIDTDQCIHVTEHLGIAALESGMASGRPSIMLRIDLSDGRTVLAETSMRLFLGAARAFAARYGWEV